MCLLTQLMPLAEARSIIKHPQVAKRGIPVYKRLMTNRMSPYKSFIYSEGSTYTANLGAKYKAYYTGRGKVEVESGLHAYTTLAAANKKKKRNEIVVRMRIPKGSQYIKGAGNEVASTQLTWPKIIKPKAKKNVTTKTRRKPTKQAKR